MNGGEGRKSHLEGYFIHFFTILEILKLQDVKISRIQLSNINNTLYNTDKGFLFERGGGTQFPCVPAPKNPWLLLINIM